MGCGRVGARIATELDADGHSVAVIDKRTSAFERLPDEFSGQRVTGDGFHRVTLERAGVSQAYAFAAVTNGDNSNIIAARTVMENYNVERVVARIYDPDRAELYERMGIPTVASVVRTGTAVLKRLLPPSADQVWQDQTGAVALTRIRPANSWIGQSIASIEKTGRCRVPFISRLAGVVVAGSKMVVQEHDELFVAIESSNCAGLRKMLTNPPQEGIR